MQREESPDFSARSPAAAAVRQALSVGLRSGLRVSRAAISPIRQGRLSAVRAAGHEAVALVCRISKAPRTVGAGEALRRRGRSAATVLGERLRGAIRSRVCQAGDGLRAGLRKAAAGKMRSRSAQITLAPTAGRRLAGRRALENCPSTIFSAL